MKYLMAFLLIALWMLATVTLVVSIFGLFIIIQEWDTWVEVPLRALEVFKKQEHER